MTDDTDYVLGPEPPRFSASDARLRAMARQLVAAEGQDETQVFFEGLGEDTRPRRVVLMDLVRRSLPDRDQTRLVGMAQGEEESTW